MAATLRTNLNPSLTATSLVLLLILFIRTTRGLDLTDEMQYYGELRGLIETGKLFSNDLFIQQSVYILFYPAFYLYHSIFGFDGLVLFGRLLMALLSILVFLYAYRKLLRFQFPHLIAGLTALSLTFAIPYHGVFAPSYNTISQVLWVVFTLKFFEWKQSSLVSLGALPVVTAFAHPTAAVMMALLIVVRLLVERDFRQLGKLALILLCGALIAAPAFLYFATPLEYLASLSFSSGYGVGATFFLEKSEPITLLAIYAMFWGCSIFGNQSHRARFAFLGGLLIAVSIVFLSTDPVGRTYSPQNVDILSALSVLAYVWSLSNISNGDEKSMRHIHWIAVLLLAYATTLGVTSDNGITQATGAFMVGLPLLLGIAVSTVSIKRNPNRSSVFNVVCVAFVFSLYLVLWTRHPYQEVNWFAANTSIKSVPAFKFISTSAERTEFIRRMQGELEGVTRGRRTLIVSEYPGLYFALGAHPETCMLFMHSLISDKSERALLDCLVRKQPEIVVDIFANNDIARSDSRIKRVLHNYYFQRDVSCAKQLVKFNSSTKINPEQLTYLVCRKRIGYVNLLEAEGALIA